LVLKSEYSGGENYSFGLIMIKITNIEYIDNYILLITFSDGTDKKLNFENLIDFSDIAQPLKVAIAT
jgi:hypothetical protein